MNSISQQLVSREVRREVYSCIDELCDIICLEDGDNEFIKNKVQIGRVNGQSSSTLPFGIMFSQTHLDSNIRHQTIAEETTHFVDYQLYYPESNYEHRVAITQGRELVARLYSHIHGNSFGEDIRPLNLSKFKQIRDDLTFHYNAFRDEVHAFLEVNENQPEVLSAFSAYRNLPEFSYTEASHLPTRFMAQLEIQDSSVINSLAKFMIQNVYTIYESTLEMYDDYCNHLSYREADYIVETYGIESAKCALMMLMDIEPIDRMEAVREMYDLSSVDSRKLYE